MVGRATATIFYESNVQSNFQGSAVDGGTYAYEVFNDAYGDANESPEDIGNIFSFTLFFDESIFNPIMLADVQTPNQYQWMPLVIGENQMNIAIDPMQFGIAPGSSLSGFEVSVTFTDSFINSGDPIPQTQPYSVTWDTLDGPRTQDNTTDNTTHTPEPATLLLIGSGLIFIAGYAAKRKRKHN
jgi:hypothetical protein